MTNIVCWTDIPVRDLDRAIAFYSAVLAAPVSKQSAGPGVDFGLLPGSDSGVSGCLCRGPQAPSLDGPLVYLSVDGRLDAAVAEVVGRQGRVIEAKHPIGPHGFRAVVVDSEGNRIALHSQTA